MESGSSRPASQGHAGNEPENVKVLTQRSLWTFLFYTLVGPFVAAVLAALYVPAAIWANLAPFTAGDHAPFDASNLPDSAGLTRIMADVAVRSFIWAPVAAAVTALGVVIVLAARGGVHMFMAGISGVIGFFVAYLLSSFGADQMLPAFAVAAGLVSALICRFLMRVGVLPMPS